MIRRAIFRKLRAWKALESSLDGLAERLKDP